MQNTAELIDPDHKTLTPRDIEILGWCPVGSVLPYVEKVPL